MPKRQITGTVIKKAGEKTGGSFKGAAVQVEQFQAKLSKVLGVFAGLAAGLAILEPQRRHDVLISVCDLFPSGPR